MLKCKLLYTNAGYGIIEDADADMKLMKEC
jgi:hypothetical protein